MKQRSDRLLPPRLQPSAQSKADSSQGDDIGDDLLYGAKAIAEFLKLPKVKSVYRLKDEAGAPIGKMPGFGLVASKKTLREWYRQYVPGLAA